MIQSRSPASPARYRIAAFGAALLVLLTALLVFRPAAATLLRPWEGSGNFVASMDYVNRPAAGGGTDIVCLFSVANSEVSFVQDENGDLAGMLEVMLRLDSGGEIVAERRAEVPLRTYNAIESTSRTLSQVFSVVLPAVAVDNGRLECRIEDVNREKLGILSAIRKSKASCDIAGDWYSVPSPETTGMLVHEPLFLTNTPGALWRPEAGSAFLPEASVLTDYLHPSRRYGIGEETLQIFFEIEPRDVAPGAPATERLFMQILSSDLDFALRDTVPVKIDPVSLAAQDGRVGVYYECDVNQLPPGIYQLSCAPLDGPGVPFLSEFYVVWSLGSLTRHHDEVRGEGMTLLQGDELDAFLAAGQIEREAILERFWSALDPDPETPRNEVHMEFRRRVAYVRTYLGGFGRSGAKDDRGRTYLLLGPPDRIQQQVIPTDQQDLEDAVTRVRDAYTPLRDGAWAKAGNAIPMPTSYESRRDLAARRTGMVLQGAFELWIYNNKGDQIFPNMYSDRTLGLRFLFVDRRGYGHYSLETTNAWELSGPSSWQN